MIPILIALTTQPASAWEYSDMDFGGGAGCSGLTWSSSSVTYTFANMTLFNPIEQLAILVGVNAWDAGAGEVNRGANFDYLISGTSVTPAPDDFNSEIWHMPGSDGENLYSLNSSWAAWAPQVADVSCTAINAGDIIFNEDQNWHTGLPSSNLPGSSIMAVTAHEAGHNMGLAHETSVEGVMYRHEFAENGEAVRLSEDDFAALRALQPGSSTGYNFLLSKWTVYNPNPTATRPREEGWTDFEKGARWAANVCGSVSQANGPSKVLVSVNADSSTTTYNSVPMEWTLSANTTCFDSDDITIGTRSPTMSSNAAPYRVGPSGGYSIPSSTPDGAYFVCAGINPNETWNEAEDSFIDNIVISEAQWDIDCP